MAPELGEIADSATQQTSFQKQMVALLTSLVKAVSEPAGNKIQSSGGEPGDTSASKVMHKPAKFYRRQYGGHGKSAGRQLLGNLQ